MEVGKIKIVGKRTGGENYKRGRGEEKRDN